MVVGDAVTLHGWAGRGRYRVAGPIGTATMFSILASVFGRDDQTEAATNTGDGRTSVTDHATEATTDPETAGDHSSDRVVDRLLEELENDELTPAERATLQEAFGGSPSRSESVSLEHLKAEVMDLRAYTDALEELIDTEGTADDRFEACHDRIDTLDARLEDELEALRAEIESVDTAADVDRIDDRMDDLEAAISTLHQELETVKTRVDDLQTWRADIEAAVSDETAQPDTTEIDPSATTTEMVFEIE